MLLVFGLTAVSHALLIPNGNGTVTDTDTNLMWVQDANLAMTLGDDADGEMDWAAAMAWVDALDYAGYDDWRLPTTPGTTEGYVNEGEMGHLYYDEGITYSSQSPFTNVQYYSYWSDNTEYPFNSDSAWAFRFSTGVQGGIWQEGVWVYAWAVRDVSVPEPTSLLLLGSGLVGIVALKRKKK